MNTVIPYKSYHVIVVDTEHNQQRITACITDQQTRDQEIQTDTACIQSVTNEPQVHMRHTDEQLQEAIRTNQTDLTQSNENRNVDVNPALNPLQRPMSKWHKDILRRRTQELYDGLRNEAHLRAVARKMYSDGGISREVYEKILNELKVGEAVDFLLKSISQSSDHVFVLFVNALRVAELHYLADLLTERHPVEALNKVCSKI